MKKQKYIITSTHLDSQGYRMTKSALENALPSINGPRKMRLGLEHIRIFPPFGVVMNGEMYQGDDKEFYLSADNVFFDKREFFTLEDGTQLAKEYFSEGNYPFIECEEGETDKLNIATDPANYESHKEIFELNKIVAVMEVHGPQTALKELDNIKERKKLESYYLYHSLLGEIYSRLHDLNKAKINFESAIKLTGSETEKKMLTNKILALLN